jgi:FtsP/CotA-like multicopper oxidase with cupredoxin domain
MKLFPSSSSSSWLLLSGFVANSILVNAADVYYDWELHAVLSNEYSVDCMNMKDQSRHVFLAEHSFPGPTIDVNEGDTVHVRITNMHPTSTVSIHYHGIHMLGTPYADGPAGVTQCALGPNGQSQEHVFVASPAGTHFWHSHAGMHIADGITGPLIVRPVNEPEPFQYDEERVSGCNTS